MAQVKFDSSDYIVIDRMNVLRKMKGSKQHQDEPTLKK